MHLRFAGRAVGSAAEIVRIALLCVAIIAVAFGTAHAGISLECVGQWGGSCNAAAVVGDVAYAGLGHNLAVLDVSNSASPIELGKLALGARIVGVAASADMVCAVTYSGDLYIINASDPHNLSCTAHCATSCMPISVAVAGDYVYIAGSKGLLIYSLADMAHPALVGSYAASSYAYGVAVSDHYAYVGAGSDGLTVLDIADPTNPVRVGGYKLTASDPGYAQNVTISGHYAYVGDGSAGLEVIDITNPAAPVLAGLYNTQGDARSAAVYGNYAYVADWTGGVVVLDVSNLRDMRCVTTYSTNGYTEQAIVQGSSLYVADQYRGFLVFDLTNPAAPRKVGCYETGSFPRSVCVSGNHAYIADASQGLQVLDVTDHSHPVMTGRCATSGQSLVIGASGNYAYIAADSSIPVIDISNPASPVVAGSSSQSSVGSMAISGDYLYCHYNTSYIAAFNISRPASPALISSVWAGNYNYPMVVSGTHLYVPNDTAGLEVIDLADQGHPVVAGSYDTAGTAMDVAVSGDSAYVADFANGLVSINVSNPASPSYQGGLNNLGYMRNLTVCGKYVFASVDGGTVYTVDVNDPSNPTVVATLPSLNVTKMTISNNYLYGLGEEGNGIVICKIDYTAWAGISGRVTDSLGNSIVGATVSTDQGGYSAATGPDGAYHLTNVLPGTYRVTVSQPNFVPQTATITVSDNGAGTVDFTLQTGGTISGCVKDNLGRPISGVAVAQGPYVTWTDANGLYSLTTLPQGSYKLTASKTGWTSVTGSTVSVTNGHTTPCDLTLQLGTITGTVKSKSGQLLSGATVSATTGGYTATTGPNGVYTIHDVLPGGYSLSVAKDWWLTSTYSTSVTGGQTATCNCSLSAAGAIAGTVTDSAGHPLKAANVRITGNCTNLTLTTDDAGGYSTHCITPSSIAYTVTISKPGYATVTKAPIVTAGVTSTCNARLANSISLSLVSSTSIGTGSYCVAAANGLAAVAPSTGLKFYDVTNPAIPVQLSTSITASDVFFSGHYAYVASTGLKILDISDPTAPTLVGSCDTVGTARGIDVVGSYAYVAAGTSGLQIIDVSAPNSPRIVGGYDTPGSAISVDVSGGYAYVADGSSGMQIIDVRNPAAPAKVGSYVVSGCSIGDVAVSGSFAYVTDSYAGFLHAVNVSNPANPVLVGSAGGKSVSICICGHYAYVGGSGLLVYDISSPADLGLVAVYGYNTNGVAASGNYVYTSDSYGTLSILTPSDFKLSAIAPWRGTSADSALAVTLSGVGFAQGDSVRLTRAGQADIIASNVSVASPASLNCALDLSGAVPGLWDVIVGGGDGQSDRLPGGFQVALPSTVPCFAAANKSVSDALMASACTRWQFKLYGSVKQTSTDGFWISDGSGDPVRICAPDYNRTRIATGKYVAVRGSLDLLSGGAVLMSCDAQIDVLK